MTILSLSAVILIILVILFIDGLLVQASCYHIGRFLLAVGEAHHFGPWRSLYLGGYVGWVCQRIRLCRLRI